MIGYLRGKVVEVNGNQVVLDVNGVGYLVSVPASLASALLVHAGEEARLQIHTQVGENVLALYGFESRAQMEFFLMLTTVDGVGPKGALAILGAGSLDEVKGAVAGSNTDFFKKVRGVGPKTLPKLFVDLAPKLKAEGVKPVRSGIEAQVEDTLLVLGFSRDQVKAAMTAVDWASKPNAETAVQAALSALHH